jgi:hypothetical protein
MKHLRRFNESLSSNEYDELKEFCENCLAYLLDEGFELELVDRYGRESNDSSYEIDSDYSWIDLYGPWGEPDVHGEQTKASFSWNEVKDYYIPFIQLLKTRYVLVDSEGEAGDLEDLVYFKIAEGADVDVAFRNFTIEDVIDDKITLDSCFSVSIKVSSKK